MSQIFKNNDLQELVLAACGIQEPVDVLGTSKKCVLQAGEQERQMKIQTKSLQLGWVKEQFIGENVTVIVPISLHFGIEQNQDQAIVSFSNPLQAVCITAKDKQVGIQSMAMDLKTKEVTIKLANIENEGWGKQFSEQTKPLDEVMAVFRSAKKV